MSPIPVALIATLLPLLPAAIDMVMQISKAIREAGGEALPEDVSLELTALEATLTTRVAAVKALPVFQPPIST